MVDESLLPALSAAILTRYRPLLRSHGENPVHMLILENDRMRLHRTVKRCTVTLSQEAHQYAGRCDSAFYDCSQYRSSASILCSLSEILCSNSRRSDLPLPSNPPHMESRWKHLILILGDFFILSEADRRAFFHLPPFLNGTLRWSLLALSSHEPSCIEDPEMLAFFSGILSY